VLIHFSNPAVAKELGNHGSLYPIAETDILEWIESRVKDLEKKGELTKINQAFQEKAAHGIKQPKAVAGISKTSVPRNFSYDPSVTAPFDLKDAKGQVFHKKGTVVNPLDSLVLDKPLLFIDGDDAAQLEWALNAMKEPSGATVILVKGPVFDLMEKHKKTLFFDQAGATTKKLGISQVPARVSQQEKILLIEELRLDL
jgi:conjugal transfer pilus assembly protein TraW